jgi:hypothetical protein
MHLDVCPALQHGSNHHVMHAPLVSQSSLVMAMNGGCKPSELLQRWRARPRGHYGDVDDLIHHAHAHGFFDCILGRKEAVDIRRAHAEFGGDVGY